MRNAFIPSYHDPEGVSGLEQHVRRTLDDRAIEVWRDLDFEVWTVDCMEDLAWARGSVHCISKVLEREQV